MSTADSAEEWLKRKTAEVRAKIDRMRAEDALTDITATPAPEHEEPASAIAREDQWLFGALRRINRRERQG